MKKYIILIFISLLLVSCSSKQDYDHQEKILLLEHETELSIIKSCEAVKGLIKYEQKAFGAKSITCEIPGEKK